MLPIKARRAHWPVARYVVRTEVVVFVPLLILACGSPSTPEPTSAEAFSVLTERLTPNAVALHSTEATYELPKPDWEALGVEVELISVESLCFAASELPFGFRFRWT